MDNNFMITMMVHEDDLNLEYVLFHLKSFHYEELHVDTTFSTRSAPYDVKVCYLDWKK